MLLALLAGLAFATQDIGGGDSGRSDLEAGLRARQSAVRSVSVHSRYTLMRPAKQGDEVHELSFVVEHIADAGGRMRYTIVGERLGHKSNPDGSVQQGVRVRRQFREIFAFDGATARALSGSLETWSTGSISRGPRFRLPANPLQFGTDFAGELTFYFNAEHSWKIAESAELEGRTVLVVDSRPTQTTLDKGRKKYPGLNWSYRFWIDPARGYVLVRAEAYTQRRQDSEPFLFRIFEGSGWTEVAPDIWMPGRTEFTDYMTPDEGPYRLNVKLIGTHEKWVVNQAIPANTFQVSFPPGVEVNDMILGRVYTASNISDGSVAAAAAQARRLAEEFREQRGPNSVTLADATVPPVEPRVPRYSVFAYTSTWLYALGILVGGVAVAIAYATLRRR